MIINVTIVTTVNLNVTTSSTNIVDLMMSCFLAIFLFRLELLLFLILLLLVEQHQNKYNTN